LIQSASDPYFHNALFQTHNAAMTENADNNQLGFERNPNTLAARLRTCIDCTMFDRE
jgi:hypothetical protein